MIFAAPFMLLGLGALAAPIVIHLLARSRTAPVEWPTLRFLKVARQISAQRSRLKHLLVLLLRLLLLTALVLAMAKPHDQDAWAGSSQWPTTLVIVLDNSYSMGYRRDAEVPTRYELAKQVALTQIKTLGLNDEVALVLSNEHAQILTDQPTRDHEAAHQLVLEAPLSMAGTDHVAALAAAFALAQLDAPDLADKNDKDTTNGAVRVREQRSARRHVLLITDMQHSGWHRVIDQKLFDKVAVPAPLTVVNVATAAATNRWIKQAQVADSATDVLNVKVDLGRHRPALQTAATAHITLWIDGQKATSPQLVGPHARQVRLVADLPAPGLHLCELKMDEDGLPIDDSYFFAVEVPTTNRITIVDGDAATLPHLAETYYFRAALERPTSGAPAWAIDQIDAERLSAAPLDHHGCLVLANVAHLDGSALRRVENFLYSGGSVLITMGDKARIDHYNRDWSFLPIRLDRVLGDPGRTRSYGVLVEAAELPIFSGPLDFSAARFFTFAGSDPTTLKGELWMSFSNGSPALVSAPFGDGQQSSSGGRVVLFLSAIDADWSNLPLRRVFVPLVDRLCTHLTKRRMTVRRLMLGRPVRFSGPTTLDRQPVTVTAPDGTSETLLAAVDEAGEQAVAVYRGTDQLGLYRVDADPQLRNMGAFAVNLDVRDSNLSTTEPEKIIAAAGDQPIRFLTEGPAGPAAWQPSSGKSTTQQRPYWPWLLLAAFVLFAAETIAANLFTRRPDAVEAAATDYQAVRRGDQTASGRVA